MSRVTSKNRLKILIEDEDGNCTNETKNVVYKEVFSRKLEITTNNYIYPTVHMCTIVYVHTYIGGLHILDSLDYDPYVTTLLN
jgi:hypothetical protein